MESKNTAFREEVEKIRTSENFQEICDDYLKNDEGERLEDNLDKFREGIKMCAKWLGETLKEK